MKSETRQYELLPLRFTRLDSAQYVMTNAVGAYTVLPHEKLEDLVRGRLEAGTKLYENLLERHFISDGNYNRAVSSLATTYRKKAALLSEFTSLFIFVVTLRCDHSCPYCQVSRQTTDKESFDMSTETAMRSLDFVFKSPSENVKIEFQGGESLLNFDLIKAIVVEAKRRNESFGKRLRFVIATNLALITDEILSFCLDNDVHISTSLDGPEDLHRANRPRPTNDSYQKVVEGIHKTRLALGARRVSALMTTTERSLSRPQEIIDEYRKQGFDSIFLRPLSPYGFAVKTKWYESYSVAEWLKFYFGGLNYIIELNRAGAPFKEKYAQIILHKMLTNSGASYVDLQSPSGLGISVLVFNYDGNVYASDESRMLAEMGETKFQLGNIHSNTYEEIMLSDALLDTLEDSITESAPMCSECAFEPYCGTDPVYHYATQNDVVGNKAKSGFCERNMAIMRFLISKLESDSEARTCLLSWVS